MNCVPIKAFAISDVNSGVSLRSDTSADGCSLEKRQKDLKYSPVLFIMPPKQLCINVTNGVLPCKYKARFSMMYS